MSPNRELAPDANEPSPVPMALPTDAMLAEIAQKPASAQELEGPSARVRGKPKKPNNALTDDARKMLKHALHGNENVSSLLSCPFNVR